MAVIQPNKYVDSLNMQDIVQVDCGKVKEGSREIQNAEQKVAEVFRMFQDAEDYAEHNWEGDTAKRFKVFRQRMDTTVSQALGLSGHLSNQALLFANSTLRIDAEAAEKVTKKR